METSCRTSPRAFPAPTHAARLHRTDIKTEFSTRQRAAFRALRPFVILLPIPPEELFQLPLTASLGINLRHARKIMVTESATAEALVREVGVAQERITLIEHPLPRQAAVFEGTAALIDLLDSLLVPDP